MKTPHEKLMRIHEDVMQLVYTPDSHAARKIDKVALITEMKEEISRLNAVVEGMSNALEP